jgi:hypothetical protein
MHPVPLRQFRNRRILAQRLNCNLRLANATQLCQGPRSPAKERRG